MGLLQKAVETYDAHAAYVGHEREGHHTLAPIGHIIAKAEFEITLDQDGNLVNLESVEKGQEKTIIPVTEGSAGRTSAPCPHPLCEQIGYLSGENEEKYHLYTEQLERWETSEFTHPMLTPILHYVKGKHLLMDMQSYGMNSNATEKSMVRFRVIGIDQESGACWTNANLYKAFNEWYKAECLVLGKQRSICMISGNQDILADQHPKGIIPINGNAKLLSSNDKSNFTYLGRFTEDVQAASVSYEASQKAHNALRWIADEQGKTYGKRCFLCWNPKGKPTPHIALPFMTGFSADTDEEVRSSDYKRELQRTLEGYQSQLSADEGVVVAAFDAATTGRLALTYYSEMLAVDFLARMKDWDNSCCWWTWNPLHHKEDQIRAIPLSQIVNCAYGTVREQAKGGGADFAADEKVLCQQMQRLIACRAGNGKFPEDIERVLTIRASNPQAYESRSYRKLLVTACAVIRKHHHDHRKEELEMELEEKRNDRSYLFGRLLAVMEKAERDTYKRTDDGREPNAIRLQAAYSQHPLHTANIIENQLERAYFPRLKPAARSFYKNLIGNLMERLGCVCKSDRDWNGTLGDTYLIGYYLQRAELYKKRKSEDENKEEG